jgi:hypothetical protein
MANSRMRAQAGAAIFDFRWVVFDCSTMKEMPKKISEDEGQKSEAENRK